MYRLLPLAIFVLAADACAGTLEEAPPRGDAPDAILDPRRVHRVKDFSKYNIEDAIRIMRDEGVVNELPQSISIRRGDLLDDARKDAPDALLELPVFNGVRIERIVPNLGPSIDLPFIISPSVQIGDEVRVLEPSFEPWRDLFNGKDIENWKVVGKALWKVEDGVIVGGQFGDPKRGGLLHTVESFTDFELELEFMIDEHGKYNSGVYLRNDAGTAARTGYQVNIGRGAAGEFCGGIYTTDWLAKGDETDTVRKIGEWNKFRILAIGAKVEVDLNGTRVVTLLDAKPDPKFLQKGVIGLQTYGAEGHDGWVKFKNIRIREVKK